MNREKYTGENTVFVNHNKSGSRVYRLPLICVAKLFCSDHVADIFLRFEPGNHDLVTAARTAKAKIRSRTKHKPLIFSAGVCLLHDQHIIKSNIHYFSPLIAAQYCFAACSSLLSP